MVPGLKGENWGTRAYCGKATAGGLADL